MPSAALALLLVQGLAASPAVPERQPAGPKPTVVRVTAADFKFDAPTTVPAGQVTFRMINAGSEFHHVQIVRLPQGMDRTALRRALQSPGPAPEGVLFVGGPGTVAPNDSVDAVVGLEPGQYGLVCFVQGADHVAHLQKGMVAMFEVTDAERGEARVAADIEIALRDYEFVLSKPATAGRRTLRIVNEAEQPHEMFIARMTPGATAQDLLHWIGAGAQGPPPAVPLGGVMSLSTGIANHVTLDLTPGTYALICFVPDTGDGRPHFMHGMATDLVVP